MHATRGIIRAYDGEPLERMAVSYERSNVFVVSYAAVDRGDFAGAIGFPEAHVRDYDALVLKALQQAYHSQSPDVASLWDAAKPLSADLPPLARAR